MYLPFNVSVFQIVTAERRILSLHNFFNCLIFSWFLWILSFWDLMERWKIYWIVWFAESAMQIYTLLIAFYIWRAAHESLRISLRFFNSKFSPVLTFLTVFDEVLKETLINFPSSTRFPSNLEKRTMNAVHNK